MCDLKRQGSPCWLYAGDFNEILYHHEKSGGSARDDGKIEKFRDTLRECGLEDLGFKGFKFTWSNNQDEDTLIQERLDRFLASEEWLALFPQAQVEHLVRVASDHCPLLLFEAKKQTLRGRRKRIFQMEEMWFQDESCMLACREA
ncbi:hypothetical protein C2S52_005519 [Perilla frutescens var. hirtella]|nr:hypothetical protein C2S51_010170 [Perilla frutescens var. frutescens]KAH6795042.1 hypothetical protein C2S52_005519 [Perilla frutescens var. hirtella]